MDFAYSPKVNALRERLEAFMTEHIYPNEVRYYQEAERLGPWRIYPLVEELKPRARAAGLWNLFLPESEHGAGLALRDHGPVASCTGSLQLLGA